MSEDEETEETEVDEEGLAAIKARMAGISAADRAFVEQKQAEATQLTSQLLIHSINSIAAEKRGDIETFTSEAYGFNEIAKNLSSWQARLVISNLVFQLVGHMVDQYSDGDPNKFIRMFKRNEIPNWTEDPEYFLKQQEKADG